MSLRTLIVIPTLQEAGNVEDALRRARRAAPTADVLVVDDNSPDGTADIAEAVAVELGQIAVLRRQAKAGLGSAYRRGFRYGIRRGYDVLIEMDADLSHDPAVLPSLMREITRGADVVIGSRYVANGATPGWPARRRLLSSFGNHYARWALGLDISDVTSGYRAYRASVLRTVDFESTRATGFGFQIELTARVARCGAHVSEVPIVFTDRTRGKSKMSVRITAEALALVTWWAVRDRVVRRHARPVVPETEVEIPAAA